MLIEVNHETVQLHLQSPHVFSIVDDCIEGMKRVHRALKANLEARLMAIVPVVLQGHITTTAAIFANHIPSPFISWVVVSVQVVCIHATACLIWTSIQVDVEMIRNMLPIVP